MQKEDLEKLDDYIKRIIEAEPGIFEEYESFCRSVGIQIDSTMEEWMVHEKVAREIVKNTEVYDYFFENRNTPELETSYAFLLVDLLKEDLIQKVRNFEDRELSNSIEEDLNKISNKQIGEIVNVIINNAKPNSDEYTQLMDHCLNAIDHNIFYGHDDQANEIKRLSIFSNLIKGESNERELSLDLNDLDELIKIDSNIEFFSFCVMRGITGGIEYTMITENINNLNSVSDIITKDDRLFNYYLENVSNEDGLLGLKGFVVAKDLIKKAKTISDEKISSTLICNISKGLAENINNSEGIGEIVRAVRNVDFKDNAEYIDFTNYVLDSVEKYNFKIYPSDLYALASNIHSDKYKDDSKFQEKLLDEIESVYKGTTRKKNNLCRRLGIETDVGGPYDRLDYEIAQIIDQDEGLCKFYLNNSSKYEKSFKKLGNIIFRKELVKKALEFSDKKFSSTLINSITSKESYNDIIDSVIDLGNSNDEYIEFLNHILKCSNDYKLDETLSQKIKILKNSISEDKQLQNVHIENQELGELISSISLMEKQNRNSPKIVELSEKLAGLIVNDDEKYFYYQEKILPTLNDDQYLKYFVSIKEYIEMAKKIPDSDKLVLGMSKAFAKEYKDPKKCMSLVVDAIMVNGMPSSKEYKGFVRDILSEVENVNKVISQDDAYCLESFLNYIEPDNKEQKKVDKKDFDELGNLIGKTFGGNYDILADEHWDNLRKYRKLCFKMGFDLADEVSQIADCIIENQEINEAYISNISKYEDLRGLKETVFMKGLIKKIKENPKNESLLCRVSKIYARNTLNIEEGIMETLRAIKEYQKEDKEESKKIIRYIFESSEKYDIDTSKMLKFACELGNSEYIQFLKGKIQNEVEVTEEIKLPSDMTIGIEIESEGIDDRLLREINIIDEDWTVKYDGSLIFGSEVTSPVLRGSCREDTEKIYRTCNILSVLGQDIKTTCGGHVHIGADYLTNVESYKNLATIWGSAEEIIYSISNEPGDTPRRGVENFARPISGVIEEVIENGEVELKDEEDLDEFVKKMQELQQKLFDSPYDLHDARYCGINFTNTLNPDKNTIEFRLSNGTITPETWIENINLFGGIVKASEELFQISKKDSNMLSDDEKEKVGAMEVLTDSKSTHEEKLKALLFLAIDEEDRNIYRDRYNKNISISGEYHSYISHKPISISKIKRSALEGERPINVDEYNQVHQEFQRILQIGDDDRTDR